MSTPTPETEGSAPHSIEAEKCVLGAMLLSKEAIAETTEIIKQEDFYRPGHQTVFQAIIDLYMLGNPVDPVTVSAALTNSGEITKIGGSAYLFECLHLVPTAANAVYYAQIVAERSLSRRLIIAGSRAVQLGTSPGSPHENYAQALAYMEDVNDERASTGYSRAEELIGPALERIEELGKQSGQVTGVPSGFADLDDLTSGFHGGQMIVVAARPGVGKALALDTPLPTPHGWTTMGEVRAGDLLLGSAGQPVRVAAATDIMHGRPCYEVTFSDGSTIIADADHQWFTSDLAARKSKAAAASHRNRQVNRRTFPAVRTTAEIARTLRAGTGARRPNHTVRVAAPLDLPDQHLPVDPYYFGVWLGAGRSDRPGFINSDPEVAELVSFRGFAVTRHGNQRYDVRLSDPSSAPSSALSNACGTCGELLSGAHCEACRPDPDVLTGQLRLLGVLSDKHIPGVYLRGSETQRRALLAGLLDTNGTINKTGTVNLNLTCRRLAADALELILTLGYRPTMTERPVNGKSAETPGCWRIRFTPSEKVFGVSRKNVRIRPGNDSRRSTRFITDARPVASVPVRCVEVADAEHLYLAGRTMIPTHNSTLGMDIVRSAAIHHGLPAVLFSLEMSKFEIMQRLLSAEARVPLQNLRNGQTTDEDWARMASKIDVISSAPLFLDDDASLNMLDIRARCRQIKQRYGLSLVVIDYLQLMTGAGKAESRQQEVSELSRNLKLLAKELDAPVIAMSQLNRGPESRADKIPQLSDLRESGSIEQDADMVILLYREDAFDKESVRAGECDLIVAKHRNGPTRTITVTSQLHYSRFADMARGNGI